MQLSFSKYQGTGNDFVMIDNRSLLLPRSHPELYAFLCHRRFGIGADGVILIQEHPDPMYDFEMVYFNSDGRESSMCGNGGRCISAFAHQIGMITDESLYFLAIDGPHAAKVKDGIVSLQMKNVDLVEQHKGDFVLDTGSPHYVQLVKNLEEVDIFNDGRHIRQSAPFQEKGINVNFVCPSNNTLQVATYERGVEAETYSCGTGVVAAAIVAVHTSIFASQTDIPIQTRGGNLAVYLQQEGTKYTDIWLKGSAQHVFDGHITVSV